MNRTIMWIIAFISFSNLLYGQVTFESSGQQPDQLKGWGVALGDFNEDGSLDAFVTSSSGYQVYFGDGTGLFTKTTQRLTSASNWTDTPAVGDINNDGHLEVITGNTVWLNDGKGHFTNMVAVTDDIGPLQIADLNGDGHLDIFAIVNYSAGRVYFNDGVGNFTNSGQRLGDGTIGSGQIALIALGDINNDGSIDAITAGWRWNNSTQCPNQIWINDGAGNFTLSSRQIEEGNSHVHGINLLDLNGDGWLDLVLAIQDTTRCGRIYMNDQAGNLIRGSNIPSRSGEDVEPADFNGDGIVDIFIAQSQQPSRVWLNDANGSLTDGGVRLGNNCYWDTAVGDFNNDGRPDIIAVGFIWGSGAAAPVEVWLNTTPIPDPNGSIENQTTGERFSVIQYAIQYAEPGDTIVMEPGIYNESILLDRDLTIQSLDPDDTYYIGGTIIQGQADEPVVTLSGNSAACQLSGLTLRAGLAGIAGAATDATIRNCRIMDNLTDGVALSDESNPHLKHCLITANGEHGLTMQTHRVGTGRQAREVDCQPVVENCVIVDNSAAAIVGGQPVIIDSLIQD